MLGIAGDRGVLAVLPRQLELTDEETFALLNHHAIEDDRYPLSSRVRLLREMQDRKRRQRLQMSKEGSSARCAKS